MANKRIELLKNNSFKENKVWIKSIRSFLKRLHWHCHFIQKLEDDPSIEFKNMHSLYDFKRMSLMRNSLLLGKMEQQGFLF